jgi:hypothetical protein
VVAPAADDAERHHRHRYRLHDSGGPTGGRRGQPIARAPIQTATPIPARMHNA